MRPSKRWWRSARGAATTEKLFVILFAILLVGGGLMVFGPVLSAKYKAVAVALGADPAPTPTLADARTVEASGNTGLYVVYLIFAVLGFAIFIAPVMFPRAHRARAEMMLSLADKFPFLEPLVNRDAQREANLDELRALGAEVDQLHRHKSGALEIQPNDFGKMAAPSEQTVDASFGEIPDIEEIIAQQQRRDSGIHLGVADDAASTQEAIPLKERLLDLSGEDDIPFDLLDPSLKPQLQAAEPPMKASRFADDDATAVRGEPVMTDAEVAKLLRDSQPLDAPDADATLVRRSAPLVGVASEADTTATESLPERLRRSGVVPPARISEPGDATTQDFDAYDRD